MRSPDRGGGVAGLPWTRASGISTPSSTEPSRHSRGRNHTVGVGVAQSRPAVRGELGPPGGCGNRPLCLMDGCDGSRRLAFVSHPAVQLEELSGATLRGSLERSIDRSAGLLHERARVLTLAPRRSSDRRRCWVRGPREKETSTLPPSADHPARMEESGPPPSPRRTARADSST
jgi:hypothetical protein